MTCHCRHQELELLPEVEELFDSEQEEYEFEAEGGGPPNCGGLSAAAVADAVRDNRVLARRLGWGCVVAGRVRPIPGVLTVLGLPAAASEEDLVCATARFQTTTLHVRADGKIGPQTWAQMVSRGALPPPRRFQPFSLPVTFQGRRLGIIEKTFPYNRVQTATHGGAEIQLGFRVTDMPAVQRAGFVDGAGEDNFRWLQVVELRHIAGAADVPLQILRRRGQGFIIDPTAALMPVDPHPYYWFEVTPAGGNPALHVSRFRDRPALNGLCYDWIFEDAPRIGFAAATPGRRAYFNFETALIGIRPTHRNVILSTVLWGFDILVQGAGHTVRLNSIRAGRQGGSPGLRRVLNRAIQDGGFAGHCFVGDGFTGTSRCT